MANSVTTSTTNTNPANSDSSPALAAQGVNVWYDLMTSDPAGAVAFYSEVAGWQSEAYPEGDSENPYTLWKLGENSIGGVMDLPNNELPAHWLAYTQVDNVDEVISKIESLGGKVLRSAFDVPKVGRIAVVADPQGAAFALFTPIEGMPARPRTALGDISWAELNTTDYQKAWDFYSQLFGWQHSSSMDMGEGNIYWMFEESSKETRGGMSNMAAQMNLPPHWLHYINVSDVASAVERVKSKGGQIVQGPMDIPGGDTIAICTDPQGAAFALYAEASGKN